MQLTCRPPPGARPDCCLEGPKPPRPHTFYCIPSSSVLHATTGPHAPGYALSPGHQGIGGQMGKSYRGDKGKICSQRSKEKSV